MIKLRLPDKLRITDKLSLTEKSKRLNKKPSFFVLLFLIPLSLAFYADTAFNTLAGPVKKEQPAPASLTEQGPVAPIQQENRLIRANEGAAVSRGGAVGTVSHSDIVLLAQVIEAEAAGEPYRGKVAVGAVIVNRTKSPDFPKTIPGVIYERDAFESVSNGQYLRPVTDESIQAATEAVSGADPAGGALYFWNPARSSSEWVYTRHITDRIGNHVFAH
ncbi:MAG: cell wall hydrolase [Desulfotomaculaceae bacterium]|nr:cell wall hydrolase [Desulfotomaculaceae bacterium]